MIAPAVLLATPAARAIGYVLGVLALLVLVWWAVVEPRNDLAAERLAHQETKAAHAALLSDLAAQTEAVAQAAVRARTVYDAATAAASTKHEQEVHRAYERGKGVAAGIRSGTVRVRDVWQDCSGGAQALPGQGTGLAPGAEAVTAGRADAIGRVLGQAGGWDADYEKALTRLRDAQALVNQCYEEPATR